jgi:hypothetical protein
MGRDLSEYTQKELFRLWRESIRAGNVMAFGELTEHLGIDPDGFSEFSQERNLWERYMAERMWMADRVLGQERPLIDVGNNDLRYVVRNYEEARDILENFNRKGSYLRALVARVTGNLEYARSLHYRNLVREGYKIMNLVRLVLDQ